MSVDCGLSSRRKSRGGGGGVWVGDLRVLR